MEYLRRGQLRVHRLSRGLRGWTPAPATACTRPRPTCKPSKNAQGIKIGCPEEAAFRRGFLSLDHLEALTQRMPKCEYRDYLVNEVIAEARRLANAKRNCSTNE